MSIFNDYLEEDQIEEIKNTKELYDSQVRRVERENYFKDLLFMDYIGKIKAHKSRYDYLGVDAFTAARNQIDAKSKKDRQQFDALLGFIKEDFLNGDNNFKLKDMICCGFEGYAWNIIFDAYGKTVYVSIPIMREITAKNLEHAHNGMFTFAVKESEFCWRVEKTSYKIEEIAEYIREYFKN